MNCFGQNESESDVILVDPHITHYAVYICDAYNQSMICSLNDTTKTSFTLTNSIPLCPMYQVSAWNSGGKGKLSEPVQQSTPQGKQAKDFLHLFNQARPCYFSPVPLVPLISMLQLRQNMELYIFILK